jgi:AcrR family transcriptional regulator
MGRKKAMTDGAILGATQTVIGRVGPGDFTLADVAKEAGLAPATLILRFGSKRGLLLSAAKMAAANPDECFDRVRARHRPPLEAIFAAVDEMAALARSPKALANNLAFLQMDLVDPQFRRYTQRIKTAHQAGFAQLVKDAIRAREIRKCDADALARVIQATVHGSMVAWAFYRKGNAKSWVRRDVEIVVGPYRLKKG